MTNTSGPQKQSDAIRLRMQQIRNELPSDVAAVRQQVRKMTDWRYQFRKHPLPVIGVVMVVGYLLVPSPKNRRDVIVHTESSATAPAKRGMISGIVAAAATMALRSGASMLTHHVSQMVMARQVAAVDPSSISQLQASGMASSPIANGDPFS